ncbi:DUF5336 domain-containing protein [Mycobacterium sp. M1]|uniref:DUF5336 domain-containing protein n=1 Tax=Mycolicibacter acidiphilus TaxID=2835306 RepID=A0ABS5RK01_9MYCO|nr:DUF5336 domain-containing protein [Mycolicibacter acidiphilus]MBS9534622.1 DUF5336 domain-containing protein [Mycolicibacter acidiphilus]
MTYPPGPPGTSGYPSAQPSGSYGASSPSFSKSADTESKLPLYLQIAVAVLGIGVYLGYFGPLLSISGSEYPMFLGNISYAVPLAVLAGLLAAVGLLPKAKVYTAVIAVVAALGALLVIHTSLSSGDDVSFGWGLWLVLSFSILQAVVALGALLLESGVITAPAPRAKYDPYSQYGLPPGGGYYGQSGQPAQSSQPSQSGTPQLFSQQNSQQSGYPSYGGGYPTGPTSGGFNAPSGPQSAPQSAPQSGGFGSAPAPSAPLAPQPSSPPPAPQGPPTPPTGFPSFGPPPGGGASGPQAQGGSAPSGPAQS